MRSAKARHKCNPHSYILSDRLYNLVLNNTVILIYKLMHLISLTVRQSCVSLMLILAKKVLMPIILYWQEEIQWIDFFVFKNTNRLSLCRSRTHNINLYTIFCVFVCVNPGHPLRQIRLLNWKGRSHYSVLPLALVGLFGDSKICVIFRGKHDSGKPRPSGSHIYSSVSF